MARYVNLERLDSGAHTFSFDPVSARYVKINGSRLRANPYDGNRTRFQVSEVEIYHMAAHAAELPTVNRQPASLLSQYGKTVSFTVEAVSPTTIRYQWYVSEDGGKSYTALSGETGSILTFTANNTQNGAYYLCELQNDHGSVKTTPASLTLVGDNLALKKPTTTSTSQTVGSYFHKNYLNDGITDTRPNVNEGWTSNENQGAPEWVTVDLGNVKSITHVLLYPRYDGVNDGYGIPETLRVLVSKDGKTYTEVLVLTKLARPTKDPLILSFDKTEARYVKLVGEDLRENPADGNRKRMQLAELEIYSALDKTPDTPTTSDTPTTTQTPTTSGTPTTTDSPTEAPKPSDQDSSPIGVIAAVAGTLLAIGAGITAFFILRKKKKR